MRLEGKLDEALHGAASLAQDQIDHLMRDRHYQEHEAREIALPQLILLKPEPDAAETFAARKGRAGRGQVLGGVHPRRSAARGGRISRHKPSPMK